MSDTRAQGLQEEAHEARVRLRMLLDASTELLDALDADGARHPGDPDAEKLIEIWVGTAIERLRETATYIKKVT